MGEQARWTTVTWGWGLITAIFGLEELTEKVGDEYEEEGIFLRQPPVPTEDEDVGGGRDNSVGGGGQRFGFGGTGGGIEGEDDEGCFNVDL